MLLTNIKVNNLLSKLKLKILMMAFYDILSFEQSISTQHITH